MILQKAPHQPLMWGTGNPEEQVRIEVFDPTGQLVIEAGAMVQADGKWTVSNVLILIYILYYFSIDTIHIVCCINHFPNESLNLASCSATRSRNRL